MKTIYHGTTSRHLKAVLAEGLVPRGQRAGNWEAYPSRPDYVYLTDAYGLYFAMAGANLEGDTNMPMLVEVNLDRLDPEGLCPDEDFISQGLWEYKGQESKLDNRALRGLVKSCKSMKELHDFIDPMLFQPLWEESLARLGNVAYCGTVPVHAITRIALIHPDKCGLACGRAAQPTIHPMNYMFCAPHYRSLCAHVLEGTPVVEPFADAESSFSVEFALAIQENQRRMIDQWVEGVAVYDRFGLVLKDFGYPYERRNHDDQPEAVSMDKATKLTVVA